MKQRRGKGFGCLQNKMKILSDKIIKKEIKSFLIKILSARDQSYKTLEI